MTHRYENGRDQTNIQFSPLELVAKQPSLASISQGGQQLLDLAGNGKIDLVQFNGTVKGFYERTQEGDWENFRSFHSCPNLDTRDPNLKFIDLTGDGLADILVTEQEAFIWHSSLGEKGFGPSERVHKRLDEEQGPTLVFADGTQSIYLADMSGDGLTDLVRIRNGEISYWPNLGYGRFGAKVAMEKSPWLDTPDLFDQRRIRLADIDGTGLIDLIYLKGESVNLYTNQSGNSWSHAKTITHFPRIDDLASIQVTDLLGNGTACLVWASPLPGETHKPMRYLDLMGGRKPYLLIATKNNLGAETHVWYAPSAKFYVADLLEGKPWITKLPFPVHVVERVETYDRISRNRFVTRYAYHHGYYDGREREFRGFGMVEQFDTEEFAALTVSGDFPTGENIEEQSHVPPVLTKTWFHTGAYLEGERISKQYEQEYYREGDPSLGEDLLTDEQLRAMMLPDTVLTDDLMPDEEPEAYRALKGAILRQEVYATRWQRGVRPPVHGLGTQLSGHPAANSWCQQTRCLFDSCAGDHRLSVRTQVVSGLEWTDRGRIDCCQQPWSKTACRTTRDASNDVGRG